MHHGTNFWRKVKALATEYANAFTVKCPSVERGVIVIVKEDIDPDMHTRTKTLVREMHDCGSIFPHDLIYQWVWNACESIEDRVDVAKDDIITYEAAEWIGAYNLSTHETLKWLMEWPDSIELYNDTVKDYGCTDLINDLQCSYGRAYEQVLTEVLAYIMKEVEETDE